MSSIKHTSSKKEEWSASSQEQQQFTSAEVQDDTKVGTLSIPTEEAGYNNAESESFSPSIYHIGLDSDNDNDVPTKNVQYPCRLQIVTSLVLRNHTLPI